VARQRATLEAKKRTISKENRQSVIELEIMSNKKLNINKNKMKRKSNEN